MIETITIPKKLMVELLEDQTKLQCLQREGVEEWHGYDEAFLEFYDIISFKLEENGLIEYLKEEEEYYDNINS